MTKERAFNFVISNYLEKEKTCMILSHPTKDSKPSELFNLRRICPLKKERCILFL